MRIEMSDIYFWSDLHFGDEDMYNTPYMYGGKPLRHFSCTEEAEEVMIDNYNSIVKKRDIVYFCGDIAIDHQSLKKIGRMRHGRKVLVMGNHDILGMKAYMNYFSSGSIHGVIRDPKLNAYITHIPVNPEQITFGRWKYSIHGHLHRRKLLHPGYINVCVENINYCPIHIDELNLELS